MDKNRCKELLPIFQAFAEGKTIQSYHYDTWMDCCTNISLYDDLKYRIKPEEEKLEFHCFGGRKEHEYELREPSGYFCKHCGKELTKTLLKPEEDLPSHEAMEYAKNKFFNQNKFSEAPLETEECKHDFGYKLNDDDALYCRKCHKREEICKGCGRPFSECGSILTCRGTPSHEDIMRMWWKSREEWQNTWYRIVSWDTEDKRYGSIDGSPRRRYTAEELLKDWEYTEVPPQE